MEQIVWFGNFTVSTIHSLKPLPVSYQTVIGSQVGFISPQASKIHRYIQVVETPKMSNGHCNDPSNYTPNFTPNFINRFNQARKQSAGSTPFAIYNDSMDLYSSDDDDDDNKSAFNLPSTPPTGQVDMTSPITTRTPQRASRSATKSNPSKASPCKDCSSNLSESVSTVEARDDNVDTGSYKFGEMVQFFSSPVSGRRPPDAAKDSSSFKNYPTVSFKNQMTDRPDQRDGAKSAVDLSPGRDRNARAKSLRGATTSKKEVLELADTEEKENSSGNKKAGRKVASSKKASEPAPSTHRMTLRRRKN